MYRLRELEKRDISTINRWRNDKDVIDCLGAPYRFINIEVDEKWYASYMGNRGNAIRCAIIQEDDDSILGLISLTDIDFLNQSAKLHIMIGETSCQNKGAGTFAVRAMLSHAFYNMNLHRIELTVLESNQRAIHLYEKCGFTREGVKRKCNYKNGKFVDMFMYSILKEEFSHPDYLYGGGGKLIPTYCIEQILVLPEKEYIIKECDTAFDEAISDRHRYPELIEKIHLCAMFFAARNARSIGYAAVYANNSSNKIAYLTLIGVKSDTQHCGVGKSLLVCCEDAAKKNGMQMMLLEVNNSNINAKGFYSHMGYKFYKEASNSSIHMIKHL